MSQTGSKTERQIRRNRGDSGNARSDINSDRIDRSGSWTLFRRESFVSGHDVIRADLKIDHAVIHIVGLSAI